MSPIVRLLALATVFAPSVSLLAKQKRLPLPAKILTAKTIFIDNQSGHSQIGDRAYAKLTKWGRFQIVVTGGGLVGVKKRRNRP